MDGGEVILSDAVGRLELWGRGWVDKYLLGLIVLTMVLICFQGSCIVVHYQRPL